MADLPPLEREKRQQTSPPAGVPAPAKLPLLKREGRASSAGKQSRAKIYGLGMAAYEATARRGSKVWQWLDPAADFIIRSVVWTVPKALHGAAWVVNKLAFQTDEHGYKHFSPWRLAKNVIKIVLICEIVPIILGAVYYYSTWRTYANIFVPNAGVYVNQQFVHPSNPGRVVAPRDEIFTVLGQHRDEKGRIQPVRFDIDSNAFFFFYSDAMRPDLAASKMVPISPYGAECTVEATGVYTRLPRYARRLAVKWLDIRAEIVRVQKCRQLTEVPKGYEEVSDTEESSPPKNYVPLGPGGHALAPK